MIRLSRYNLLSLTAVVVSHAALAQSSLPMPDQTYQGAVGRVVAESPPPQWPKLPSPPEGAPNVLVILTDDVGFGATATFGGPVPTGTLDALAGKGLRYTEFHTTAMCSPTRAALLTGRNHNNVGVGFVQEGTMGYDGFTGAIPRSAGTVAEILKQHGYNTAAFGKWHLVPLRESGPTGPFDHWPTGLGFEYFYGFLNAQTNQWAPTLFENTRPAVPPRDQPGYTFDRDMADHAIAWIRQQKLMAPAKPFYAYYATGTSHVPHNAPKDWIAKFKGRFDQGWDALRKETFERQKRLGIIPPNTRLTPRPDLIPAWNTLTPQQKALYARMMEVYAAALAYSDDQVGRVIDAIRQLGQIDNTLVIFIEGDNGASSEQTSLQGQFNDVASINGVDEDFADLYRRMDELGGPTAANHYPIGWANAMNTPFQWFKEMASHFGGTRNGMVMSWPSRIKDAGGIRTQFHHVIDLAPTILEAAGLQAPAMLNGIAQKPLDGVSMQYTFDHPAAASTRRVQYFEMLDNLAIYADGWVAATRPDFIPWLALKEHGGKFLPLDARQWELYHIADDYSEAVDLAAREPKKLRQLQDLFWIEASRNQALPLFIPDPAMFGASAGGKTYRYAPGMIQIPEALAPGTKNRSYSILADVVIPAKGAEGVLVTQGGRFGGYGIYLLAGRPVFVYNLAGQKITRVAASEPLAPGRHVLAMNFTYDGGGRGKGGGVSLQVDGAEVARGRIDRTLPTLYSISDTFDVGEDTGSPVTDDYASPFKFSGQLKELTVELK